ncbi:MAG: hypothetical protein ACK42G_06250 [Candidatus Kapaibacteriota bacterium]
MKSQVIIVSTKVLSKIVMNPVRTSAIIFVLTLKLKPNGDVV